MRFYDIRGVFCMEDTERTEEAFAACRDMLAQFRAEAAKRVVGQQAVLDGILMALIAGGHVLLEGVPGLAKTLAVKTCADMSGLSFKRVQFTPDLLPADITGTLVYEQQTGAFSVHKGPVFANVLLADEINRAPAKVQSALLEAMAEKQVTIGETSYPLPEPFFVLATQNPIEQEGTYDLPEAELDRFLIKLIVPYPSFAEEVQIVQKGGALETAAVNTVLAPERLLYLRRLLEQVVCDEKITEYIVSITGITRPAAGRKAAGKLSVSAAKNRDDIWKYLAYGASPRASIALCRCAKVQALFAGRPFVLPEDVKQAAPAVLRHRLVLSYEAAADGVTADSLIAKILSLLPVP